MARIHFISTGAKRDKMMLLFKHKWNRIAVRIATISFCLGTVIMLAGLMATNDFVITLGLIFLVMYIPITILLLFALFVNTLANFKDIHEHIMTLIIVLMNVPIALLYIYFLNI